MHRRMIPAVALLLILASSPAAQTGRKPTAREVLEERAESVWDAAHDKNRPKRGPEERAAVQALFEKIDALTRAASFSPETVAGALGLPVAFEKTRENEHFAIYEAKLATGSIRAIELRVGADAALAITILAVDQGLRISPGEVIDRLGHGGVGSPSLHAPPGSPYYYAYPRPEGELRIGIKPGSAHAMESAVWDTHDGTKRRK